MITQRPLPEHELREIMNAILYADRTGVQWRYLPHDFPNWNTVYGYFAKWQADGVFRLNGLLRELVRQQEGRHAKPSACVIDAQSVKTSTSVPAASQGTDNAADDKRQHAPVFFEGSSPDRGPASCWRRHPAAPARGH